MNKKRIIFFLAFFSIFFLIGVYFLFFNIFQSTKTIEAGSADNVSGWAWSENIGWISFNCNSLVDTNGDGVGDQALKVCDGGSNKNKICNSGFPEAVTCPGASCVNACNVVNYGVNINADGTFSGYAWSENIGWIKFDPVGPYPTCPISTCPTGSPNYSARVDLGTGKVTGWARVCAAAPDPSTCGGGVGANLNAGGWDGWILLGPIVKGSTDYGVSINKSTGDFSGWAWSDMVIGWINFQGGTYGVKTSFPFNQKPIASGLDEIENRCAWGTSPQVAKGLAITLKWTYFDEDGDPQTAYEIWLDDDSNFTGAKFNYKVEPSASTAYNLNLTHDLEGDWLFSLNWNTTYYWKVKVRDEQGAWSDWSDVAQFTTPLHASPYINFSWNPTKPTVDELVQFTDLSECYDSSGNVVACTGIGPCGTAWCWTFQDGSPSSSIEQNPTTSFSSMGSKIITLRVTDSDGYSCSDSKTVQITLPLPEWEEISPF